MIVAEQYVNRKDKPIRGVVVLLGFIIGWSQADNGFQPGLNEVSVISVGFVIGWVQIDNGLQPGISEDFVVTITVSS